MSQSRSRTRWTRSPTSPTQARSCRSRTRSTPSLARSCRPRTRSPWRRDAGRARTWGPAAGAAHRRRRDSRVGRDVSAAAGGEAVAACGVARWAWPSRSPRRRRARLLVVVDDHRRGDRRGRDHRDGAGLRRQRTRPGARDELRDPVGRRRARPRRARGPAGERQRHDRGRRGAQRQPRPVHELAHGALAHAELARHFALGPALDRDPQQRLALAHRQRGQPGQRVPRVLAPLHLVDRHRQPIGELRVVVARRAQRVQRRVVDDPVQPRPQIADLVTALQRTPRRQERLLDGVLGPGVAQIAPRRPQQQPAVALHDDLERPLVPGARQRDQPLIRLRAK